MEINTSDLYNEVMKEIKEKEEKEEKVVIPEELKNDSDKKRCLCCEEEDLIDEVEDDFSYQIIERGKDYFQSGNVILCCKNGNKYYAKVRGTSDKPYIVRVEITEDGVEYKCSCPYNYSCKHEYAVLMAISNQEYSEVELKPEIKEKKDTIQNVIDQIPAEELKDYITSPKGQDYVCFEVSNFEEYFRKYYPSQSYEYYYNNLYNDLVVDGEYIDLVDSYINKVRQYISNQEYEEGFKIIKSIINAYKDTNTLNVEPYVVTQFPTLGMLLRIIYRKCNQATKEELNTWISELSSSNYYDNVYLEDIILTIK